jgi:serine/threonine-protein kinase
VWIIVTPTIIQGKCGGQLPVSDYTIRTFRLTDVPTRGPILEAVRAAGFTVERIEEDLQQPDKWGLVLKPGRQVADLFRLDREVLLWCTNYPRFQARDIEDIRGVVTKLGVRLTRSFVILVSRYDPATRNALEAESALDTTIAHFSMADLKQPRRDSGESTLVRLLLDRLYTRDLYDLPVATTRGADFFGRRKAVDSITDELITGDAQIGVFGLRKVGKTSLANRVVDTVSQSGRCIVARLDLQWTTSIDPQPEYTLWALGEAIYASSRIARNVKGLKLFGRFSMASEARAEVAIWEAFAHDLTLVLQRTSRRLVVALDEIERLIEVGETGGFIRLGRLLRGFDQQYPGRLRLLISGTSPECAEASTIFGSDNPFYRYLSLRYLGPLDGQDPANLLKQLGQPIGLEWTADAIEYALSQTGGHPASCVRWAVTYIGISHLGWAQ